MAIGWALGGWRFAFVWQLVGGEADWVNVCWEGLKGVFYKVPADAGDRG